MKRGGQKKIGSEERSGAKILDVYRLLERRRSKLAELSLTRVEAFENRKATGFVPEKELMDGEKAPTKVTRVSNSS